MSPSNEAPADFYGGAASFEKADIKPVKKGSRLRTTIIVLVCIIVPLYALLTAVGIIAYPKWYLLGSFYFHKSSFEYIRDSGKNFSNPIYDRYDFDECSDKKLAKSIKTVIRCHYGEARWDKQWDSNILMFYTDNYQDLKNSRGILYSDKEIERIFGFYYDYRCVPLGDGWYYYEVCGKGEYYMNT
ncbi:MAG: hypothetical protein K2G87_00375 [Oscillospiraceae bacterium]|nr:hypothetical protein [Oscillospiraceae bacterium]